MVTISESKRKLFRGYTSSQFRYAATYVLITSAVLLFVYEARPELLMDVNAGSADGKFSLKTTLVILAVVLAILIPVWKKRRKARKARKNPPAEKPKEE